MYLVKRIGLKYIYDYKFIGLIMIIGIGLMFLITILYSHILLRYILIILYGCMVVIGFIKYKNKILSFLRRR